MEPIEFKSDTRLITDLIPADYNPRKLSEKQMETLNTSIERFNFVDPIIINKNNRVIGGHQRLKVLKERGISSVDVRVPNRELTVEEEKELNLRLNKNTGDWDFKMLVDFGKDMLVDVGFDTKELDKIFSDDPRAEDDEVPEVGEVAITQKGDIWALGKHRLICGDSTSLVDVERLMDGNRASLCLTDPPYSVNYKSRKEKTTATLDSYEDPKDAQELLDGFLSVMPSDVIVMTYASAKIHEYVRALDKVDFETLYICMWLKNQYAFHMSSMYNYQHEPIFIARKKKSKIVNNCAANSSSVFEYKRMSRNNIHPTQKPLELYVKLAQNHSNFGDIIFEPFCGSGTTLMAAERTDRICYGVETSPLFCDVIVKRWEQETGLVAEKTGDLQAVEA